MNQVEKTAFIRLIKQLEQGLRDERPNRFAAFLLYTLAICWLAGLALHRSSGTEKLPEYFVIMGVAICLSLVCSHVLTITNFRNLKATRDALEVLHTELVYQEVRCTVQDSLVERIWKSDHYEMKMLLVDQLIDQIRSKDGLVESNVLDHYVQDLPQPIQELIRVRCRVIHHDAAEKISEITSHEIKTHELACTTTIQASVKTMEEMRNILGLVRDIPNFTTMGLP